MLHAIFYKELKRSIRRTSCNEHIEKYGGLNERDGKIGKMGKMGFEFSKSLKMNSFQVGANMISTKAVTEAS